MKLRAGIKRVLMNPEPCACASSKYSGSFEAMSPVAWPVLGRSVSIVDLAAVPHATCIGQAGTLSW